MATVSFTPDQDAIFSEVLVLAPPERVFQALTDPTQLPKWWGQAGDYRVTKFEADVRPGGKWKTVGVGADGKEFEVYGEYVEVDPPRVSRIRGRRTGQVTLAALFAGNSSPAPEELWPSSATAD